jgi:hypothetical protein
LRPRQKSLKGRGPRRMWEWRLTLPSDLSFWELEFWWTPESLESDYIGQNTSHWKVLYIIGKLLKCRCLKWALMTHLDICNTSYGKKKGHHKKSGIDPNFVRADGVQYIVGKLLTRATTLLQTSSWLKVRTKNYGPTKLRESNLSNFGTSLWNPKTKRPFGCGPRREAQRILYRGRWWLPSSPGHGESYESKVAHGLS